MLEISVPCQRCGSALRFGESRCKSCGSAPSRDVARALHERLLAASTDYRELQDNVSSTRAVLLIIALIHAASGVIAFVAQARSAFLPDEMVEARARLAENLLISAAFLAAHRWAAKAPIAAMASASAAWVVLQLAGQLVVSLSSFAGLWIKLVALVLLLRGLSSSLKAQRFLKRLTSP
jgi:hypothetical protein